MRWRPTLTGALLGALLGLTGQFVFDFFCWQPSSERGRNIKTYNDYFFHGTSYNKQCGQTFEGWLKYYFGDECAEKSQARLLFSEALFLNWLLKRGELASNTMLIVAFLGALPGVTTNQLREKRKALKEVSAS